MHIIMKIRLYFISALLFLMVFSVNAQNDKKKKNVKAEAQKIIQEFKSKDPGIAGFFNTAYGYAVFPAIGKGGLGIGGAGGKGIVYEGGTPVGEAKMTQVTIGLQAGGQKYAEVIFFENADAYNRFTGNNFEFASQVSAIALQSGVSADAKYRDGMLVFTMPLAGLMYEASVGGQKFKVDMY